MAPGKPELLAQPVLNISLGLCFPHLKIWGVEIGSVVLRMYCASELPGDLL